MPLTNTSSTLKSLESIHQCFICEKLPSNPHILWCTHSFCKECIMEKESCPLCGFKVTPHDVVPNIMLARLLSFMDGAANLCNSNQSETSNKTSNSETTKFKNCSENVLTLSNLEEGGKCINRPKPTNLVLEDSEKSALKTPKTPIVSNNKTKLRSGSQNKQCGPNTTTNSSKKELNKVNLKGETPLQIVARQGKLSKVKELLSEGANPNVKDYAGWTPLCDAVGSGKIEVVRALLEAGAGVNTPAHQNTTALVEAVVRKNKEMIKLLMSYGADMNQRTSLNNTALSIANEEMESLLMSCNKGTIQQSPRVTIVPKVVFTSKLDKNNSEQVKLLSQMFNLSLSEVFTEEVSHIVVECGEDNLCEESLELMQGVLTGCCVVGVSWVSACLAENKLLPEDQFEPTAIRGQPGNQVFARARNNHERLLPRLFDGCHFALWHEQRWSPELRQEVKMLVTLAGAKFLPRACDAERIPVDEQTVMFHAPPPSPLAYTSHIVLYQPGVSEPQLKYNMDHIKTLPLDWFYRSISSFTILPPDF